MSIGIYRTDIKGCLYLNSSGVETSYRSTVLHVILGLDSTYNEGVVTQVNTMLEALIAEWYEYEAWMDEVTDDVAEQSILYLIDSVEEELKRLGFDPTELLAD